MEEPKTVLELLRDPKRWTKGALARNATGDGCNARDGEAVCFCLVGALERVYLPRPPLEGNSAHAQALCKLWASLCELFPRTRGVRNSSIPQFNDVHSRTHAQLIKVLEHAQV